MKSVKPAYVLGAMMAFSAYGALAQTSTAAVEQQAPTEQIQVQEQNGIRYFSGGVGTGERERLESLAQDFNLKVITAVKDGSYLSDVNVAITDAKGDSVLNTETHGPWLYVKLPSGHYKVTASAQGKEMQRDISVGSKGQETVQFTW